MIDDAAYIDGLIARSGEPAKTPVECVQEYLGLDLHDVRNGTFLAGVEALRQAASNVMIGPRGGVFRLSVFGTLVFMANPALPICLSADDLLGVWCWATCPNLERSP